MVPRTPDNRIVALLLVGALLLCHGALGALHLVHGPQPPPVGDRVADEGHAGGTGHGKKDPGEHPPHRPGHHGPGAGYSAVLLGGLSGALLGGLALSLLLSGGRSVGALPALGYSAKAFSSRVIVLARGPTLPALQVFRL